MTHLLHRNDTFVAQKSQTCYCSQQMFPKSRRQPRCTLQLVCEDRVLFVSVDLRVSVSRQRHPNAISNSPGVSTFLLQTSLFIQPHKRKSDGVSCGVANSCISVTFHNQTHGHMNFFFHNNRYRYLLKYSPFLLNHSVLLLVVLCMLLLAVLCVLL